jgi:hypothetical protein
MRRIAMWTSIATILTLNIVIVLGLLDVGDTLLFGGMLAVLHVVLPISSILMLAVLVKERNRAGVALFGTVVAGMLVVGTMQLTGPEFSRGLHLITDLYALNAYLIGVHWVGNKADSLPSPL